MLLKLAWRNIWRNRRRTLITASSIAFAVLFCGFMGAIEEGGWDNMINNVVSSYTGNIQIHKKGYWDNPSINDLIEYDETLKSLEDKIENVSVTVPRLESYALISTGDNTRGTMVVGIHPERETSFSKMADRVVSGSYLDKDDQGALIGDALAEIIGSEIGDTIILIGQGYHGVNAAGKYPIRGLVHFPSPQFNKSVVILTLESAQSFYGAENLLNALVVQTKKIGSEDKTVGSIASELDTSAYEVMTYEELLPELIRSKQIDTSGNYIIYFILYMIIAFGIFGTILMMMKERQYEFGVLMSIGMEKINLFLMVWLELFILGAIGVILGTFLAYGVAYYFQVNPIVLTGDLADAMEKFEFEPIMPASTEPGIFVSQALIVFAICALIIIFPFFHIWKLEPVKAMRE